MALFGAGVQQATQLESELVPHFAMPNGRIPALAFGSGSKHRVKKTSDPGLNENIADPHLVEVLSSAINSGYTHLDTAECYTTRLELAMALKQSGLPRSTFWITDKYDVGWPDSDAKSRSWSGPKESVEKGLSVGKDSSWEMEYYDLFLLHSCFFTDETCGVSVEEAWLQLEQLLADGKVKNIGVSNFDVPNLEKIMKVATVKPMCNQIEFNIYLQNQSSGIFEYCNDNNILIEAYCPLTPILDTKIGKSNHPLKSIITAIAKNHQVAESSVCLRWIFQSGVIPVTTSSNPERMKQAFEMFTFELSPEEYKELKDVGNSHPVRTMFMEYFDKGEC
ncbi:hypothetical protein DAMA08_044440 [Martiniozyma asiatica (nom. inval.)]|nr:hypothetical protein DAMA08_044440 [Martiniozyma asiatica]